MLNHLGGADASENEKIVGKWSLEKKEPTLIERDPSGPAGGKGNCLHNANERPRPL